MFAKCPEDIYDSTMKLNNFYKGEGYRQAMLEIINWSDGHHSLLEIADKYGRKMLDLIPLVDRLVRLKYLVKLDGDLESQVI
jgi:aminopeptidase-like protein